MLQREKFLPFLLYIEDLIRNEIFLFYDMFGFFKSIMTKILEMKQAEHLQLLLDHFQSGNKSERQEFSY